MIEEIYSHLTRNGINCQLNESLKKISWLKSGGTCNIFVAPTNIQDLSSTVDFFSQKDLDFDIIGWSSNIYFLDNYHPNIVVSTRNVNRFSDENEFIYCECGVNISTLAKYAVSKGYKGYSGFINLPGCIGSAICNNSSCFDCRISDILIDLQFYDFKNKRIITLTAKDLNFSHRDSSIKNGVLKGIILTARLSKEKGNPHRETHLAHEATKTRKETQEVAAYTLGSVFATRVLRKNWRNFAYRSISFFLRKICKSSTAISIRLLLFLYGYSDLRNYISNKNINTFIWKQRENENLQNCFFRYMNFMNEVYLAPRLEIEIKGNY